ncbi:MAG: GYD domain-containing protein [Candidatus Bathycorpusculaceae bacterium]
MFVTLLSPKGKGIDAVKYLKGLKEKEGIKIKDVYFTFGRYDGVMIFEAPDERAAMKFVMETVFQRNIP